LEYKLLYSASEISNDKQLEVIANALRSGVPVFDEVRTKLNIIVMREIKNKVDEFKYHVLVEDLLSSQMLYMRKKVNYFKGIIRKYVESLKFLQVYYSKKSDGLKENQKIHYLTVRYRLHTFFNAKDEKLTLDLRRSIKKLKNTKQFEFYLNLLERNL
jgi:hypothetical protein